MAERPVMVGLVPQAVVLDPGDQVSWFSDAGNLKVEFDANRCPDPAGLQSGPIHLSGRRRLLHRHVDLRVVSRRADPPLARSRQLAPRATAARAGLAARPARRAGLLRRLGALPLICRRQVLARLYRRQALRRRLQGRAQLHRHRAGDRGFVVRPGLRQLERFRSVAVSRRRRTQMVRQHGLEPSRPGGRPSEAPRIFRYRAYRNGTRSQAGSPVRRQPSLPAARTASSKARISSNAMAGTT